MRTKGHLTDRQLLMWSPELAAESNRFIVQPSLLTCHVRQTSFLRAPSNLPARCGFEGSDNTPSLWSAHSLRYLIGMLTCSFWTRSLGQS